MKHIVYNKTRQAIHISSTWELKDMNKDYEVGWGIIDKAATYNPSTKKCNVCLKEKSQIMYSKDPHMLNKRQQVLQVCRHMTGKRQSNCGVT